MTDTRPRVVLASCLLVLLGLGVAWVAWPRSSGRADLVAGPPSTTSTTTTTTTPTSATSATTEPVPSTTAAAAPVIAGPERLRIESLGVDAPVVPVGLEPDGLMEIPAATEVGWYRLGPSPGSVGSAVLAAHVDYAGQRGAFFDLTSIQVGAEVVVEGAGVSGTFVVTEREQIAKDDVELADYFTDQGPSRLTLITCGGAFDQGVGHYEDNIIITAVPVPAA